MITMLMYELAGVLAAAADTVVAAVSDAAQAEPGATPKPKLPQPGTVDLPAGLNTKLGTLMGWGLRLGYVAAFFGFIVAGLNLYRSHMEGGSVNFGYLTAVAGGCLIIGSAGALADMLIF